MKTAAMLFVLFPLASVLPADEPPAKEIQSAHYVTVHESKDGSYESEWWVKADKVRREKTDAGGKHIAIKIGKSFYMYEQGKRDGYENPWPNARLEPLKEIELWKKEGKKIGIEVVDGIACDKYEYQNESSKVTVWFSQANQFPYKTIHKSKQADNQSVNVYKKIDFNTEIPDSLFTLPTEVTFKKTP